MDDKQNQPEFMVASMRWHINNTPFIVFALIFPCPLSKKQSGGGPVLKWCLPLVTARHSWGFEIALALLQMGGIFIGSLFVQPFSLGKWGFKANSRQLFRLQNLSSLVTADMQNELKDPDLYYHYP